jgi:ligand-binding SRPBCC domain-containing protein
VHEHQTGSFHPEIVQFSKEIWLPRPPDAVFAFFMNAENLQSITPPWLDFRIVTPLPIQMKEGTEIDYRLRLNGIPMRWRSRIVDWQPPHHFVDVQIAGPYKAWRHRHSFESTEEGTLMRDHVDYRLIGGPLAPLINTLMVAGQLRRIFAYRERVMRALFDPQVAAHRKAQG